MSMPEPDTKPTRLTAAHLALVQRQLDALADARVDGSIYEWAIASQLMDHIRFQEARIAAARENLESIYGRPEDPVWVQQWATDALSHLEGVTDA